MTIHCAADKHKGLTLGLPQVTAFILLPGGRIVNRFNTNSMEGHNGFKPEVAYLSREGRYCVGLEDRVGDGLGATAGALCTPCGVDREHAIVGPPTPDVWVTSQ